MKRKKNRFEITAIVLLTILAVLFVFPLVLLIASSITEENTLLVYGYSIFPKKISFEAYRYILVKAQTVLRCYGNSILYTAIGLTANLLMSSMLAFALSNKSLPGRRIFSFIVFFTMLFNGGIVPSYLMWTNIFKIKNSIWAQIVPNLMMSGMSVVVMRTYFETNIPADLYAAAEIDGAGMFRIYRTIALPLAKPILVSMGLFAGLNYWNDWTNGLYYVSDTRYYNIQNYLQRLINDTQYLLANSTEASGAETMLPSTSAKMAIACIAVLPMLCVFPFLAKYFKCGITMGAVKG